MNTQEVVNGGRKALVLMASAITALVLAGCSQDPVAGQATAPATAGSTLAMTPVQPTAAADADLKENPFLWASARPYSGSLHVDGLNLKLKDPIPEVQDDIEAVANLGSRCTVVIPKYAGVAPDTFGISVYLNPKDLGEFQFAGGQNADQADILVHGFDAHCA